MREGRRAGGREQAERKRKKRGGRGKEKGEGRRLGSAGPSFKSSC